MIFKSNTHTRLSANVDPTWCAVTDGSQKRRTGYLIIYGKDTIYTPSCLQRSIFIFSAETVYEALPDATKTIEWLRNVLN